MHAQSNKFVCELNYGLCNLYSSDIDECSVGVDECSVNAICSNTDGSYDCSCIIGYVGDGRDCSEFMHIFTICICIMCIQYTCSKVLCLILYTIA